MSEVSLRHLAQKYARGEIEKDEYRNVRTELIHNVLSRESTLKVNEYPSLLSPTDDSALDITQRSEKKETPQSSAASEPPLQKKQTSSYSRSLYIAGGLAFVIISIIIVILVLPGEPEQEPVVQMEPEAPVVKETIQQVSISAPARELISSFLSSDAWDRDSLDRFLFEWRGLSEPERQSVRNSIELNQLTNAIYNRLLEERAIAGLDTTDTEADTSSQERLIFFARRIGIDDPRISIQRPESSGPEPAVAGPEPPEQDEVIRDMPEPAVVPEAEPEVVAVQPVIETDDVSGKDDTEAAQIEESGESVMEETPEPAVAASPPPPVAAPLKTEVPPARPGPEAATPAVTETKTVPQVKSEPAPAPAKNSGNCNLSLVNSRRPYCRDVIAGTGNGPTMVIIPQGNFMMGGDKPEEQPRHNVVIKNAFAMSVHEITYGEYLQYCQDTQKQGPSQPWAGNDYPVVNVSWHDATAYTEWLSAKTGQRYRLPSESQWEYAARGGTRSEYPFGDTIDISYAVFSERKSLSGPLPKTDRTINRNKFRLYHIVGNVREWVADAWNNNYQGAPGDGSVREDGNRSMRIVRGGSYQDQAEALRSAARIPLPADTSDNYTGFRIIQEL